MVKEQLALSFFFLLGKIQMRHVLHFHMWWWDWDRRCWGDSGRWKQGLCLSVCLSVCFHSPCSSRRWEARRRAECQLEKIKTKNQFTFVLLLQQKQNQDPTSCDSSSVTSWYQKESSNQVYILFFLLFFFWIKTISLLFAPLVAAKSNMLHYLALSMCILTWFSIAVVLLHVLFIW